MAAFETIAYAIRDQLLDTAGVTAITSDVYPFAAPQLPDMPFILYHTPEDEPYDDIKGSAGLFRAKMQLDAYSDDHEQAWQLAEEIRKSLQGYTGINKGVTIKGVQLRDQFDVFKDEIDNFRVLTNINIWYKRVSVPA